mmetsp:Transcript_15993/g.31266  ORF Transcript_15993/g.31266 Transcript_15993/m.31266 type:complete len:87 (+) Transcript_15993:119-379(+)
MIHGGNTQNHKPYMCCGGLSAITANEGILKPGLRHAPVEPTFVTVASEPYILPSSSAKAAPGNAPNAGDAVNAVDVNHVPYNGAAW